MDNSMLQQKGQLEHHLQQLKSSDSGCRREAAEVLAGIGDERGVYPLIRALYDENSGVQQSALDALVRIGGELTVYCALPLLRDDDAGVRNMAVEILQKVGPSGLHLLVSALKDRDPDVRKMVTDILGILQDRSAVDPLIGALQDPNRNVRAAVVTALGHIADARAVEPLTRVLKDEEWVAFFAAGALGRIGDSSASNALLDVIRSEQESVSLAVRLAALDALGEIGEPGVTKPLLPLLDSCPEALRGPLVKTLVRLCRHNMDDLLEQVDPALFFRYLRDTYQDIDPELNSDVIRTFDRLGNPEGSRPVLEIAGEMSMDDPEVLDLVLQTLVHLHNEPDLISLLSSGTENVMQIAVKALGSLKAENAVPALLELYDRSEPNLQTDILDAVSEIGGQTSEDFLINALKSGIDPVRRAAARGLSFTGGPEVIGPLFERLGSEECRDVIAEIVKSILAVGGRAGIGVVLGELVKLMVHPSAVVREAVAKGLGQIDHPEGLGALLDGVSDADVKVRKACVDSLGRHGGEEVTEAVILATYDEKEEVRLSAVHALESRRRFLIHHEEGERILKAILSALHDEHMRVRCRAAEALGRWGDQRAIPYLMDILQRGSEPLQVMTIIALGELKAKEAEGLLRAAAAHKSSAISRAANEAIAKVVE